MSKKRGGSVESHVRIYRSERESRAYLALKGSDVKVLIELRAEYAGRDDNEIKLPYKELHKRTKLSMDTMARCFFRLECYGWIDTKEHGGLFGQFSVYALSTRWKEISKLSEKELKEIEKKIRQRFERKGQL